MFKKILYQVTCHKEFKQWLLSNPNYEKVYEMLGQPKPFDVTLRDGLQGLSYEQQINYNLLTKENLYKFIIDNYCPNKIEIGSIVSEKVYPIFSDTLDLLYHVDCDLIHQDIALCCEETKQNDKVSNYVLVPNSKYLNKIINNPFVNHFAFITSVSDNFQIENTKMTLRESDEDIKNMLISLSQKSKENIIPSVKLYVSCINECPIKGKINNDFIVKRLLKLSNLINITHIPVTICLSDTCGTLTVDEFEYIIFSYRSLTTNNIQFSLHLHVISDREKEVELIIHKALDYGITEFDTSHLETGGCAKVVNKNDIKPNLSYLLYYHSLMSYIKKQTN